MPPSTLEAIYRDHFTLVVRMLTLKLGVPEEAKDVPQKTFVRLSDAEDFTEGYRTLHLGSVVGEPTGGWIIYTSGMQMLDGSILRVPHTRIQDAAGRDMEMAPRPVDSVIERPLGETMTNADRQLSGATTSLLQRVGREQHP